MLIEVKELCVVEINEEETTAIRTVVYESDKDNLLEAFNDYAENFDIDNVIICNDEFEGECLDIVKCVSVKEVIR